MKDAIPALRRLLVENCLLQGMETFGGAEPASILRRVQAQLVAKHVEQRGIRRRLDLMRPAIDEDAQRECSC